MTWPVRGQCCPGYVLAHAGAARRVMPQLPVVGTLRNLLNTLITRASVEVWAYGRSSRVGDSRGPVLMVVSYPS
jgi:hypothetical protein